MIAYRILNCVLFVAVISCSREKKVEKEMPEFASVAELNRNDSTFIFLDFQIAITPPLNWKPEKINDRMFVFKMNCDSARIFCPNLVARFIPLEQDLTLTECAELFLSSLQSKFKNFELVNSLDKEVGKFKIKVVDYKMFENNTNLGGTTAFVILEGGKYVFALSIMAENDEHGSYVMSRRLFEKILNSLKPA